MNPRNFLNLALALILGSLITLAFYKSDNKMPADSAVLTTIKAEDVKNIDIVQNQFPRITLEKINDQWQMIKPYNNLANTIRISKFLRLTRAKSHAQYPASSLKQLGLNSPDLSITLNNQKFSFGTTDALNGFRYVLVDDTVHLITDRYSYLIQGEAAQILNPALLPDKTLISTLRLPELSVQTTEKGLESTPVNNSASADQLQQLLDEWRFARALRVSKTTVETTGNSNSFKTQSIEVFNDKNEKFRFNMLQTEEEIILTRADIGLRYHFTHEAGGKLLNIPTMLPSTKSN